MERSHTVMTCIVVALLTSACEKKSDTTTTSASPPITSSTATPKTEKPEAPAPAGKKANAPTVTWKDVGLATPESVLYDEVNDVYLVSNINGQPADVDGNGFISKLSPGGKVENLKWIEGGKNKVTLNAPKGLALMGDLLYVADIDTVRMFDRKTGTPQGEVKVAGATFLNDVVATTDGRILVSDTGVKPGPSGFESTGTDAVYQIDKTKKVTPIAKSKELGGPNGLWLVGDKIWVATNGSGELYALDAKGKKSDVQKLPKGSLDGLVALPGGDVLISSWDANAIYRGKPGGEFAVVVEDVKSPADIGYDSKRARVLVPLFEKSEVQAYDLK